MMRFERFTERAQDAAMRAYEIMQRYGHHIQVDVEHCCWPCWNSRMGSWAKSSRGWASTSSRSRSGWILCSATRQVFITPRVKRVLDRANEEANRLGDEYISTEHIFLAILRAQYAGGAHPAEAGNVTKSVAEDGLKERCAAASA
jgi:ATP-dependent Clp protease ATP-binding subunit ClpC